MTNASVLYFFTYLSNLSYPFLCEILNLNLEPPPFWSWQWNMQVHNALKMEKIAITNVFISWFEKISKPWFLAFDASYWTFIKLLEHCIGFAAMVYVSNIWQFLWNFAILFLDNCSYEHHTIYYVHFKKFVSFFKWTKEIYNGVYARRKISWIKNIPSISHRYSFQKINIQPNKI